MTYVIIALGEGTRKLVSHLDEDSPARIGSPGSAFPQLNPSIMPCAASGSTPILRCLAVSYPPPTETNPTFCLTSKIFGSATDRARSAPTVKRRSSSAESAISWW